MLFTIFLPFLKVSSRNTHKVPHYTVLGILHIFLEADFFFQQHGGKKKKHPKNFQAAASHKSHNFRRTLQVISVIVAEKDVAETAGGDVTSLL